MNIRTHTPLALATTLLFLLIVHLGANAMYPAPDRRNVVAPDTLSHNTLITSHETARTSAMCTDWGEEYRLVSLDDVDTVKLIDIYTNIALLLEGIEYYDYSFAFLEKAYTLSDERNDAESLFQLRYEMVILDIKIGDFARALEDLKWAQKLEVHTNTAYRNMLLSEAYALYYQAQGQFRLAIDYFQNALASAHDINARDRFSMLHLHYSKALRSAGLQALAAKHLDSAMLFVPPIYVNGSVRNCDITRAEIFAQMGDWQHAKEALLEALAVAHEIRNRWLEARFGLWLSKILIDEKDYQQAYHYKQRAMQLCDSLNLVISLTSFKLYDQKMIKKSTILEQKKLSLHTLFSQNRSRYTFLFLGITISFGIIFLLVSFRSYQRLRDRARILQRQRAQNAVKNSELILNFAHTENLRTENQYKNEQQETARRSLLYKNSLIMNSIEYANTIQLSLRPHQDNMALRFPNHCIIYRPNNIVSGDLLWFADLPTQSIFVLADCSGHEVAGAALSFIAYMKLNQIVREDGITKPTDIIQALATQFYDLWKDSTDSFKMQSNVKMGVLLLDHDIEKAYFAGASQSLFYSEDGVSLKRYSGKMHTISLDTPFKLKDEMLEIALGEKTTFYMMTDGFIEQPDKDNIKIGSLRTLKFLNKIITLPMEVQRQQILAYFARHRIGMQQVDDMTILGLSLNNASLPPKENGTL